MSYDTCNNDHFVVGGSLDLERAVAGLPERPDPVAKLAAEVKKLTAALDSYAVVELLPEVSPISAE